MFDNRFSRRRFMQYSAAGAGVVAVSPYLSKLKAFAAPPVADNQGIVVTIDLAGGNDGLNMVIPYSDAEYAKIRSSLRVTNSLPIGSGLGLHPSMPKLKERFDAGQVAVIRGVGYNPADLSHFTSGDIWMRGWGGTVPDTTTGWLGRYLDTLPNADHESLYGVSLHGNVSEHLWSAVAHPSSLPLSIGGAFGIDRSDPSDARMFDAIAALGNGSSGLGPLGDLYDMTESDLMLLTQRIRPAYGFPDQPTDIQTQLVLAAHLINANLGIRVFDTELDGFDTHSDQHDWHATLLGRLDAAIQAFFATLSPRWRGQVVVMTFSEFGRRPEENGDHGTDHGTAAPHFVIGSKVRGGLYGSQPSLTHLDNNGNLIPAVDFHQMYASVLDVWMGANATKLLGKAYSPVNLFLEGPSAPGSAGPMIASEGVWVAGPTGQLHAAGIATKFSSLGGVAHPIVAGASTGSTRGLWLCGSDGGIFPFGDAKSYGNAVNAHHAKPFVGMAATPTGKGYWLVASDGAVFAYGDAKKHGDATNVRLAKPIVAMAATPTGGGYWLCASDGGIFAYGDAKFHGSTGNIRLAKPIVTLASTPSGKGYWFCASDGGIFAYGDAKYHGTVHPAAGVCGMARTRTGKGYWIAAHDGTIYSFGDAAVYASVHESTSVIVAS
jgi:uncharacterized protein (DUF1501 family)